MPSADPLIVALYAGPGTGKSTTMARLFADLKIEGYNAEMAGEVAKNWTWEGRHHALGNQSYVHAKQIYMYDRLKGKVDVILTDTSPLFSLVYSSPTDAFREYVVDDWRSRNTMDVFIQRHPDRPYSPHGRRQSEESAINMDGIIQNLWHRYVPDEKGWVMNMQDDASYASTMEEIRSRIG